MKKNRRLSVFFFFDWVYDRLFDSSFSSPLSHLCGRKIMHDMIYDVVPIIPSMVLPINATIPNSCRGLHSYVKQYSDSLPK
jgi:hypothetical protein